MPRTSLIRVALPLLACLPLFAVANVATVGEPQPAQPLATYGMQVEASKALRDLLPAGWQVQTASDTSFRGKVSWGPGDTWVNLVERVAQHSGLDFTIDWTAKRVTISAPQATPVHPIAAVNPEPAVIVAASTASPKELPVAQPAVPAPTVASIPAVAPFPVPGAAPVIAAPVAATAPSVDLPSVAAAVASGVGAIAVAAIASPAGPAITATSAQIVVAGANREVTSGSVSAVPQALISSDPARAFNRVALRDPLQALADSLSLKLIEDLGSTRLPGVVTLELRGDLQKDVYNLNRALGRARGLSIVHYRAERELVVELSQVPFYASYSGRPQPKRGFFDRMFNRSGAVAPSKSAVADAQAGPAVAAPSLAVVAFPVASEAVASTFANSAAIPAATFGHSQTPSVPANESLTAVNAYPTVAHAEPVPVAAEEASPPTLRMLLLELNAGERLSVALERFLSAEGWNLRWQATSDSEAMIATRLEGASIAEVLSLVLPSAGLSADVYNRSRDVLIRNAQPSSP